MTCGKGSRGEESPANTGAGAQAAGAGAWEQHRRQETWEAGSGPRAEALLSASLDLLPGVVGHTLKGSCPQQCDPGLLCL